MRYLICDKTGLAVNVCVWDTNDAWTPPKDHYVVYAPAGNIGDSYNPETDEIIVPDRTGSDPIPEE